LQTAAATCPPPRDFAGAVAGSIPTRPATTTVPAAPQVTGFHAACPPAGPRIIAEIKKRSPSAGVLVADFDPVAIARQYHRHGAAALSVLTDEPYFGGRLEHIAAVKAAVPLPVLRKDFIIDDYQLYESRVAGADAVLLIAEVLGAARIAELLPVCHRLTLAALVEVHSEDNLRAVRAALGDPAVGHYLLGINNRDLTVQRTDLSTTARLAATLPPGVPFISESGIHTRTDVLAVGQAGACAVLVGEIMLRARDIGEKLRELRGSGE